MFNIHINNTVKERGKRWLDISEVRKSTDSTNLFKVVGMSSFKEQQNHVICLSNQVIKGLVKFNLDTRKVIHVWKTNPSFIYKTTGSEWTSNTKVQ